MPALSEKDEDDLRWGLRVGADMIALSFVRSADDIRRVHEIMDEEGHRLPVIAKIEKPQAVENLDEIIRAFDASWWPAATSASRCRWSRSRSCRSAPARSRAAGPSRSSSRPRCSSR